MPDERKQFFTTDKLIIIIHIRRDVDDGNVSAVILASRVIRRQMIAASKRSNFRTVVLELDMIIIFAENILSVSVIFGKVKYFGICFCFHAIFQENPCHDLFLLFVVNVRFYEDENNEQNNKENSHNRQNEFHTQIFL